MQDATREAAGGCEFVYKALKILSRTGELYRAPPPTHTTLQQINTVRYRDGPTLPFIFLMYQSYEASNEICEHLRQIVKDDFKIFERKIVSYKYFKIYF